MIYPLLFLSLPLLALSQRIEDDLLVKFTLNQCQCLEDIPIPADNDPTFELIKFADVIDCPIEEGFSLPTTQGVLLDTSGDISGDFALLSANDLTVDNSQGFTVEAFIRPLDLIAVFSTSVVVFDLSPGNSVLPNFRVALSFNPFKPAEVKIVYTTFLIGGSDDFEFIVSPLSSANANDLIQIVAGFDVENGNIVPFACFNAVCQTDAGFNAPVQSFPDGKVGFLASNSLDLNLVAENFHLVSAAIFETALSQADVTTNNDENELVLFPVVRADLSLEAAEDQEFQPFSDNSFFLNTGNDADFEASVQEASESRIQNGVTARVNDLVSLLVPINENFFTSSDNVCNDDAGDSTELFQVSVSDVNNLECVLPAVPVSVCVVEVNDAPVAVSRSIEVLASVVAVPAQFDGNNLDIDDVLQFEQEALGVLAGGTFTVEEGPGNAELLEINEANECQETVFTSGTFDENNIVSFCFRGDGSLEGDTFTYRVADVFGLESQLETITVETVDLAEVCLEQGSCLASTIENEVVEVVLEVSILDAAQPRVENVIFEITSFPENGIISSDRAAASPFDGVIATIAEDALNGRQTFKGSVFYTPNDFFFNRNADGGNLDLLGEVACPTGLDVCEEEIEFEVTFGADTFVGTAVITVNAVDNDVLDVEVEQTTLVLGDENELGVLPPIEVVYGNQGDVFPITASFEPFDGLSLRAVLPNGAEFLFFNSNCDSDALCTEIISFQVTESVFNEIRIECELEGVLVSSISVELSNAATAIAFGFSVEVNQNAGEELDFVLLGGGAAAAVVVLAISCFAFTRLTGRKRSESDKLMGVDDVELYDEEEQKERNVRDKVEPPTTKKKPKRKVENKPQAPPAKPKSTSIEDAL